MLESARSMDVESAYRKLGLKPGAPLREVMEAHRDLVTVWDPRRFDDNPRLRKRATDETAVLNEAFQVLRSHLRPDDLSTATSPQAGAPSPGVSLFDDAMGGRRKHSGKPRAARLGLVILLALAVVVLVFLLRPGGDGPRPSGEQPERTDEQQDAGAPEELAPDPDLPVPEESGSLDRPDRAETTESGVVAGSPAWQAFETLRQRSAVVSALVDEGRFGDLSFVRWRPVRAAPPEILIDVLARDPEGGNVHLVWGVNLEASSIRAMSESARVLTPEGEGPTPRLIREN